MADTIVIGLHRVEVRNRLVGPLPFLGDVLASQAIKLRQVVNRRVVTVELGDSLCPRWRRVPLIGTPVVGIPGESGRIADAGGAPEVRVIIGRCRWLVVYI